MKSFYAVPSSSEVPGICREKEKSQTECGYWSSVCVCVCVCVKCVYGKCVGAVGITALVQQHARTKNRWNFIYGALMCGGDAYLIHLQTRVCVRFSAFAAGDGRRQVKSSGRNALTLSFKGGNLCRCGGDSF